jgi:hypothetical protein
MARHFIQQNEYRKTAMNGSITEEIVLDYSNTNRFKEGVTDTLKRMEISNCLLITELKELTSDYRNIKKIAIGSVVANAFLIIVIISNYI